MVRHATYEMIPELKRIWVECFPEDADYVELFFTHYFTPEYSGVYIGDEGITTAAYYFPAYINVGEGTVLPIMLLYGGACSPQYRGRGYVTEIMHFLLDKAKREGCYGTVVNSRVSSRHIVERAEMHPLVHMRETEYAVVNRNAVLTADLQMGRCSFQEFARLRHRYVDMKPGRIFWADRELEYMYRDIEDSGQIIAVRTPDGGAYYAVVTEKQDHLLLRETDYPKNRIRELLEGISAYWNYSGRIVLQTPEDEDIDITGAADSQIVYFASLSMMVQQDGMERYMNEGGEGEQNHLYFNLSAN